MKRLIDERGGALVRALVIVFALSMLVLILGSTAGAVHNVGVFELDTDTHGANATNEAAAGDDWDNVCHQVVTSDCGTSTNTTGATAVSWLSEPDRNTTIFTGGGSKDDHDISDWLWKDGAGGLPDKDNLRHAFAVRYSVAPTAAGYGGTDPTPGTNPNDDGNCPAPVAGPCDVLYFGIDRFDNSGDAQLGFWFLHNKISTTGGTSSQGGTTFTGDPAAEHVPGDLLILSDFSVGGTTSTIAVYEWVTSGGDVSTHLNTLLPETKNLDCSLVSTNDSVCGIVNKDPTPGSSNNPTDDFVASPWPFTDKSGNVDKFAPGELYEGGLNLSAIGLGGTCFASFESESRASTSPTATLKDFVLGGFGQCTSGISSVQTWTPKDSATVTVTPASKAFTGTIQFTLYPNATCTGTYTYQSNEISISGTGSATKSTDDATTQPSAIGASGNATYCWKIAFVSLTDGVPDATWTNEQTVLTIDNDVTSP
jgi:hypothetical protein